MDSLWNNNNFRKTLMAKTRRKAEACRKTGRRFRRK